MKLKTRQWSGEPAHLPAVGKKEMEMNEDEKLRAKQWVQSFFDFAITNYVLGDLQRLTHEVRPEGIAGLRGCTVPLALALFSVIDLFGYLLRDEEVTPRKIDTFKN